MLNKFLHFPLFHIFSEFSLNFSSPDYENLPSFTYCSSALGTSYSRQWTSVPVTSHKWLSKNMYYPLADAQMQGICAHYVTSLKPITHEGTFLPLQFKQLAL
jgi:hypothetical protein